MGINSFFSSVIICVSLSIFGELRAFFIADGKKNLFNIEHFAFESHDGWVEFRPPLDGESQPDKTSPKGRQGVAMRTC
jgi:hypothetical protein